MENFIFCAVPFVLVEPFIRRECIRWWYENYDKLYDKNDDENYDNLFETFFAQITEGAPRNLPHLRWSSLWQ